MRSISGRISLYLSLSALALLAVGCGGGSNTASSSSTATVTQTVATPTSNVQSITVNTGPASSMGPNFNYIDGAFTSVTVCVPGSTTSCQTISGILIDTGSSGLRVLSSALTVSLPQQTGSGGSPVAECAAFADGVTWGPVVTADVKMAGEQASSLPIQVIGSSNFSSVPGSCTSQGETEDTLADLGANGLLGIGQAIQDCGSECAASPPIGPATYYVCPTPSGCSAAAESLAQQVQNPVASFATDNNGVVIELPSVTGAESTVSGSLIFGIGTQSNNGLGGATVFGTDAFGDFRTTFGTTTYPSFLDSGSNAIYFLNTATTSIPVCTDVNFWYCPASTQSISVMNAAEAGTNGASAAASFPVGNADTLISNVNNAAAAGLAGPSPGMFDFGLPFFFGRNIYTAFDGKSTTGGTGPYSAY